MKLEELQIYIDITELNLTKVFSFGLKSYREWWPDVKKARTEVSGGMGEDGVSVGEKNDGLFCSLINMINFVV